MGRITPWTEEELKNLRSHYPASPWKKLLELLPRRTKTAIQAKAQKLQIARKVGRRGRRGHRRNTYKLLPDHAVIFLTGYKAQITGRVKVDLQDLDALLERGRWCLQAHGEGKPSYAYTSTSVEKDGPSTTLLHRFLAERMGDLDPESDLVVDHKNGDGLDNRRQNLQVVHVDQNLRKSRTYPRRAPDQMGLPEGTRRANGRIYSIVNIDRRCLRVATQIIADFDSEQDAIARASGVRQGVQRALYGDAALAVDAEVIWEDHIDEREALELALSALERRSGYQAPMGERYWRLWEGLKAREREMG